MIWLLILIIPGLLFTLEWLVYKNKTEKNSDDGQWVALVFGTIALVVGILIVGLWTISNYLSFPEHQAFYQVNAQNYAITVDETSTLLSQEKYISEALIPIEGSIEKTDLAKTVSERIVEWRDAVNNYNRKVASLQYLDKSIIFGIMIPNRIHELKLLSIGE